MANEFCFKCANCSGLLQAEPGWIGLETTCPLCGKVIVVPQCGDSAPPPPAESSASSTIPPGAEESTAPAAESESESGADDEGFDDTKTVRLSYRGGDTRKARLKEKILQLPTLPTIPANISLILGYLRDVDVDLRKVLEAIKRDPILVARIIKVVNSGYYGMRSQVTTLEYAFNLLGFTQVREVILATSVMQMLTGKEKEIWRHSYSTYKLMELFLTQLQGLSVAPNIQLAALMHDIGQVVLEDFDPLGYKFIRLDVDKRKQPLCPAEHKLFEIDHAEAGAWLLEHWQTADEIVIPILFHHSKEIPPSYVTETALLHLADWIDCQIRGIQREPLPMPLLAMAGLDKIDCAQWCQFHSQLVASLDFDSAF